MAPDEDPEADDDPSELDPEAAVVLPVTDVLDLHPFAPREVKELVADYLALCAERGLAEVRIIHGKGTGTLRRIVHAVLDRHPAVRRYGLAPDGGGWGATVVELDTTAADGSSTSTGDDG